MLACQRWPIILPPGIGHCAAALRPVVTRAAAPLLWGRYAGNMTDESTDPVLVAVAWAENKRKAQLLDKEVGAQRRYLIDSCMGSVSGGGEDTVFGPAQIKWRRNPPTPPTPDFNLVVQELMSIHGCDDFEGLCAQFGMDAEDFMIPGKDVSYTPVVTVRKLTPAEQGLYTQAAEEAF